MNYCLGDIRFFRAKGELVPFIYNKTFKKFKNLIMDEIVEIDFSKHKDYERAIIDTIQTEMETNNVQVYYSLFELYYEFLNGNNCESEIARELSCLVSGNLDFMAMRTRVVEYAQKKIVSVEDLAEFSFELNNLMKEKDELQKSLNNNTGLMAQIHEESRAF